MEKIKIYGGFVNLDNLTFNIYEYDAEETDMNEYILNVSVPVNSISSTNTLTKTLLNRELKLDQSIDFYPRYNFVYYSKEKDIVEDKLDNFRRDILNFFKNKVYALENSTIHDKGHVDNY